MKRAKRSILLLASALLLLALSGCGGQSAEGLAKRVARAASKVQITQATVTSGIVLELAEQDEQDEPSEAGIRTVMTMQLSADPKLSYAETDVVIQEGSWTVSDLQETWLQPDGETLATFARLGSTGQWVRAAVQPAADAGGLALLAELDPARLTLAPEQQEVNGVSTVLLSVQLSGRELAAMLGGVAELQQALGELNWKDAAAIDTTFYIDPKTRLPVRIELKQENASLPGGLTGRLLDEADLAMGEGGGWLHVYYDAIGYEPIEPPALPAEGLSSALTEEQLKQSGAQYVIEENGQKAYLRLADDWRVYAHTTDEASVIRGDGKVTATYVMYTPDADSDFFLEMIDEKIAAEQTAGSYVTHETGPKLGDFETLWVECSDRTLYYAWGKAGDACLYLYAAEQEGGAPSTQHLSSILRELIRMVMI